MINARGRRGPTEAAPSGGAPRSGNRIAVIDGLRLMAALAVAGYHYAGAKHGTQAAWGVRPETAFPELRHVAQYGFLGVELFFMISGFVICMSTWGRTPGAFFRSRIIRLFPAYWAAVVIVTVVLYLWPIVRKPLHWSDVLVNLTMMQSAAGVKHADGAYWTLWNEALFYLLFAFMVWRGLTLRRTIVFGYAWLIASMLSLKAGIPLLKTVLQPDYAAFFVAGIAFYLIHRFGPDLLLWGLVALSFLVGQYWTVQKVEMISKFYTDSPLSRVGGVAVVGAFFVAMAVIALGYTANIQWRWLTTAGLLTYPFYLLHENIGWTVIQALRGTMPRAVLLLLVIGMILGAAYLLHRLVEKPVARLLKDGLARASDGMGRPERHARAPQPAVEELRPAVVVPPAPEPRPTVDADTVVLPTVPSSR
jgi:peptidoglycan/LPS O-acetylase OafA/YrhL